MIKTLILIRRYNYSTFILSDLFSFLAFFFAPLLNWFSALLLFPGTFVAIDSSTSDPSSFRATPPDELSDIFADSVFNDKRPQPRPEVTKRVHKLLAVVIYRQEQNNNNIKRTKDKYQTRAKVMIQFNVLLTYKLKYLC